MSDEPITVKTRFPGDDEPHAECEVERPVSEVEITLEDAVHTGELRELIEQWREERDEKEELGDWGSADSLNKCVSELEGLMSDE